VTVRRRIGWVFVAFGAVMTVLALGVSPVNAEAPSKAGWWFELQGALPAAVPSPPVVPKDGFFVQQTPQGPSAYGAVHYDAKDIQSATLTLAAAQGSTTTLGAPLQACATSSPWETPSPQPGRWSEAPKYTSQCTPGAVSSDGKYVAFLFDSSFVKDGAIDVAIVPKDGAPPFAIAFDHPADDSLVIKAGSSTTKFSPPTTTPAVAGGATSAGATVASPSAAVAARPVTPVAPAAPAAPSTAGASPPAVARTALNLVGFGDPDRGARMAALTGASAIVIGWWLLSTRAVRMPQLLGAMAGGAGASAPAPEPVTRVGGVGRFAKTRTDNARRLR
jgi:hypothetical protein